MIVVSGYEVIAAAAEKARNNLLLYQWKLRSLCRLSNVGGTFRTKASTTSTGMKKDYFGCFRLQRQ